MVGLVEADRAGLDRAPVRFGHQRDDRGAVYTAGEEGAKRDVGDHARADGRPHDIGQLFGERVRLAREGVAEVHVPPGGGLGNVPAPAYEQIMAGGELADAFDDAGVVRPVAEGEILGDGWGAARSEERR